MNANERVNGPGVKAIRELRGMKQGHLAKAIGRSQSYLSLIESGARYPTDMATAKRIAEVLRVDVAAVTFPANLSPENREPAA